MRSEGIRKESGNIEVTMKKFKLLFFLSLAGSASAAIAGFYIAGLWQGVIAVSICSILWLIRRYEYVNLYLLLSLIIAVTGMIIGASNMFLTVYSGLSL